MKYGTDDAEILHGDCMPYLALMKTESVDMIFADPPYNIGKKFGDFKDCWPSDDNYIAWCKTWIDECVRILKPTGSIYLMGSTQAMPYLDLYLRSKLEILSRIVWSYDSSGVQAKKFFGSMYEPILYAVKDKKHYKFNSEAVLVEARTGSVRKLIDYRGEVPKLYSSKKVPGNVWDIPRVRYRMDEYEEHPSQKPQALLERAILASTDPGDLVLDPFSGTFTTSAVAKRLGRRSIGIERHSDYVKIGLRRVLGETVFEGETLAAIRKNTVRRNMNGVKAAPTQTGGDLFNVGD